MGSFVLTIYLQNIFDMKCSQCTVHVLAKVRLNEILTEQSDSAF